MRLRFSIAWIVLATTPAPAATITLSPQTTDRPTIVMVEGPLVRTDGDEFAAKTAPLPSAFVAFSSDGGSLLAGLRIGEAIRRKRFSTIVPDGRRCASACALAWLGGVERFIGSDGRIRFHAASDSASDRESGITNTVVGTYLAKVGLPFEAVTYITQVAPNEMMWLNMSDVAERGIRVTLLSSLAKETVVAIPTRYGDATVTRDDPVCCIGHITYGDQQLEIVSTGQIYASLAPIIRGMWRLATRAHGISRIDGGGCSGTLATRWRLRPRAGAALAALLMDRRRRLRWRARSRLERADSLRAAPS